VTFISRLHPGLLSEHYKIDEEGKKQYEVLEAIAESRACLTKGGGFDLARASKLLLDDFRGGKLGRITLEMPPIEETGE
ncbi:MAG: ribosome biogenesis GTPase YlqF, partial [Lachnospiraceae bacterium]|nr:ribosome biogenesis GTPase YlqF [Lachnospiraceae bacterium]